jgi:hypothetical protein
MASQDSTRGREVNTQMETHGVVVLVTTILTLLAWRVW